MYMHKNKYTSIIAVINCLISSIKADVLEFISELPPTIDKVSFQLIDSETQVNYTTYNIDTSRFVSKGDGISGCYHINLTAGYDVVKITSIRSGYGISSKNIVDTNQHGEDVKLQDANTKVNPDPIINAVVPHIDIAISVTVRKKTPKHLRSGSHDTILHTLDCTGDREILNLSTSDSSTLSPLPTSTTNLKNLHKYANLRKPFKGSRLYDMNAIYDFYAMENARIKDWKVRMFMTDNKARIRGVEDDALQRIEDYVNLESNKISEIDRKVLNRLDSAMKGFRGSGDGSHL